MTLEQGYVIIFLLAMIVGMMLGTIAGQIVSAIKERKEWSSKD